ncbi:MAG: NAD-dependent epimerase/dehydratase family protein [Lentisphaerae bacterium]|nr:NAD-dependent epimerase/dehydratase family protein [Lentisphaerota bacterium]MCP4100020.1 NAD-dependent epimerase/dehydratase family protein [Lentisphaerota bacterium]
MNKKRILVVGANGYIGRYLVKLLLDMKHDIVVHPICQWRHYI